MRFTRIAATLVLAFLLGGSSAEVALKTRRAFERHRAAQAEGAAGDLVSLEVRGGDGRLIAAPRVIVTPGRAAELVLRDPENPDVVRVSLRLEAERQLAGDLLVTYFFQVPSEAIAAVGRVSVTPGVEQRVDLGDHPAVATLFTIPVPSAAFDAYLDAERAANAAPALTRM